jgi:hypothetical protein
MSNTLGTAFGNIDAKSEKRINKLVDSIEQEYIEDTVSIFTTPSKFENK